MYIVSRYAPDNTPRPRRSSCTDVPFGSITATLPAPSTMAASSGPHTPQRLVPARRRRIRAGRDRHAVGDHRGKAVGRRHGVGTARRARRADDGPRRADRGRARARGPRPVRGGDLVSVGTEYRRLRRQGWSPAWVRRSWARVAWRAGAGTAPTAAAGAASSSPASRVGARAARLAKRGTRRATHTSFGESFGDTSC